MDLMPNMKYARSIGVIGGHALRLYRRRVFYPYWGQLLANPLVTFVHRVGEPSVRVLRTKEDLAHFQQDDSVKVCGKEVRVP